MINARRTLPVRNIVAGVRSSSYFPSWPCDRRNCIMRRSVGFGENESLFVRVAAHALNTRSASAISLSGDSRNGCGRRKAATLQCRILHLQSREQYRNLDSGFYHRKIIMPALKMVMGRDRTAHNGKIGIWSQGNNAGTGPQSQTASQTPHDRFSSGHAEN